MPRYHYLQNTLATSSFLLPVVTCVGLVLWLADGMGSWLDGFSLVIFLLSVGLILELNNTYVLLRIRSRAVSSFLCIVCSYSQFVHSDQVGLFIMLCLLLAYHQLFHTYQNHQAVGQVFFCFFCLGICCLIQPWLICLILPFFLALVYFRALDLHCFCAMLVGLALPGIFLGTYAFLTDQSAIWLDKILQGLQWSTSDYNKITKIQLTDALFLTGLATAAIFHFVRFRYQDKIKTRTYLSFLSWMCLVYVVLMLAVPRCFNSLYLALCITASPLIGHNWALSSGKWRNRFFCLTLILVILLAILNLWTPSFNF